MQNDTRFTRQKAAARIRLSAAISASLMLGACAGGVGLPTADFLKTAGAANTAGSYAGGGQPAAAINDLQKATAYWGQRYAKEPAKLETALAYAKNLKAMGQKRKALAVLQQASIFHGTDKTLAGEYGRLALEAGQVKVASRVLAIADDPTKPDWRVISARGAALAKLSQYAEAIPFFEKALTLSNEHPSVLNNLALAHAMNGDAARAESLLRQATATGSAAKRVRQNLALVLGLQGKYEEATQVASRDLPMAEAVQRVGAIRQMVKLDPVSPMASPEAIARAWAQGTTLRTTQTANAPTTGPRRQAWAGP